MIHCEIAGNGLPLVLLHGIGSSSKSWRRQLRFLSQTHKVIAWDAPGYGKSDDLESPEPTIAEYARMLAHLLDAQELDRAVVLGHSLGGIIAQEFYRAFSHRVAALILCDTTQGGGAEPEELRNKKLTDRLRLIRTLSPSELAQARAPALLSPNASRELVDEAIAIMSEVRPRGYEAAARAMSTADTRGVLDSIDVPLLMIWGAEDAITPAWTEWPKLARVEVIPGAGHLCYAEQPEKFNAVILDFGRGSHGLSP